jgi:hypothetical protein
MANKTHAIKTAPAKDIAIVVGKKLTPALKATPTPTATDTKPMDTNLGPNEKFPFGIKIADAKRNISWERFKTDKERDERNATVKGKRVDFQTATPAALPVGAAALHAVAAQPPIAKTAPAAKPKAMPKADAAPKDKAKADGFAIHVNKTGRVCFGNDAAERISAFVPDGFMTLEIANDLVRLQPTNNSVDGALPIRDASGRPYVSATRQFKALGFDGRRALDIEAKPFGKAGFTFRLR